MEGENCENKEKDKNEKSHRLQKQQKLEKIGRMHTNKKKRVYFPFPCDMLIIISCYLLFEFHRCWHAFSKQTPHLPCYKPHNCRLHGWKELRPGCTEIVDKI